MFDYENKKWILSQLAACIHNVQVKYTNTSSQQQISAYRYKGEQAVAIVNNPEALIGSVIAAEAVIRNVPGQTLAATIAEKYTAWMVASTKAELLRVKYNGLIERTTSDADIAPLFEQMRAEFSEL